MRRVSLRLAWLVTAAAAVVLDDTTIRDAVTAWLADATAAEATYGHISAWDTSQVTDMKQLFQDSIFNDDISAWDTSAVTSMFATFQNAKQFNQPLNDWEVSGVTSMVSMFAHAESFNQPLDFDVDGTSSPYECVWSLVCPAGQNVNLEITGLETELQGDFVQIWDGDFRLLQLLATLEGNTVPSPATYTSTSGSIDVTFVSDGFGVEAMAPRGAGRAPAAGVGG